MERQVYNRDGVLLGTMKIVHDGEFKGTFSLTKEGLSTIVKDKDIRKIFEENYDWFTNIEITNTHYYPLTKSVYMKDIPIEQQKSITQILDYIDRLVQNVFDSCLQEWER